MINRHKERKKIFKGKEQIRYIVAKLFSNDMLNIRPYPENKTKYERMKKGEG